MQVNLFEYVITYSKSNLTDFFFWLNMYKQCLQSVVIHFKLVRFCGSNLTNLNESQLTTNIAYTNN